jgi:hypothetical protein
MLGTSLSSPTKGKLAASCAQKGSGGSKTDAFRYRGNIVHMLTRFFSIEEVMTNLLHDFFKSFTLNCKIFNQNWRNREDSVQL